MLTETLQVGGLLPRAIRPEVFGFLVVAFVGGLAVIYSGFQTYSFGRTIRNTSTETARGVAMGRTELEGSVAPAERVFDQPFTEGRCVYAEYKVREYEESADDDEDKWVTKQEGSVGAPFYLDDGTGRVYVDTDAGEPTYEISNDHFEEIRINGGNTPPPAVREYITGRPVADGGDAPEDVAERLRESGTPVTGDDAGTDGEDVPATDDEAPPGERDYEHVPRGEIGEVSRTNQDRRYLQRVLPVDQTTYVYGGATPPDPEFAGDVAAHLEDDPETGEFIVSDQGESDLAWGYTKRSMMYIQAGIVASAVILALVSYVLLVGPVYGPEAAMP